MSLMLNIADYIASNTDLVVDTNLFVGQELPESPDECATIIGSPGFDSESGLEIRPFQILVRGRGYVTVEERAFEVYDLFKNKPGFPDTIEDVFYCEILNSPFPADRDGRGRYVFSSNYIIRKKEAELS